MTDEIVVGLDASPSGLAALAFAARRARSEGRSLRAVHVSSWTPGMPSHHLAVEAMYRAMSPGNTWRLQILHGWPGEVLVRESEGAALLVVGHFDRPYHERKDPASVSHYCLTHALCPVLGVVADPAGPRPGRGAGA